MQMKWYAVLAILYLLSACNPSSKKQNTVFVEDSIQAENNLVTLEESIQTELVDEKEIINMTVDKNGPKSNLLPRESNDKPVINTVSNIKNADQNTNKNTLNIETASSFMKKMVLIPSGTFFMGSENGEIDERPVHQVVVKSFYIGKFEISQKEWNEIMSSNPSSFKGNNLPVENISWFDALNFCNELSEKEGLEKVYEFNGNNVICNFKASGYRLPTEEEWEYAARGGVQDLLYAGSNEANIVSWYNVNSTGMTNETGQKQANYFGLYDMSGNASEWCWDIYGAYFDNEENNAGVLISSKARVVRGGNWGNNDTYLRVSARNYFAPHVKNSGVGFRVARSYFL